MNLDAIGHRRRGLCHSLSLMIMIMVVMRMVIATNVYNEARGIVSDHVEKFSLKTQLVNLILAISSWQHWDDAIHFPHSGLHKLSLSLLSRRTLKTEFVNLEEWGDVEIPRPVDSREVSLVAEGTLEAKWGEGLVKIEDRVGVQKGSLKLHPVRHKWLHEAVQWSLIQFGLEISQTSCNSLLCYRGF